MYDEVHYTIENPQTYLGKKMDDLMWTTQLEVDIPPRLSWILDKVQRIVGDPENNTMTIK